MSDEWVRRLSWLDEARDGKRLVHADRVHFARGPERPPIVTFGASDVDGLYSFALVTEHSEGRAFSREFAAFAATVDGVIFDGDVPFIRRVADWSWEDRGPCVGSGGYSQGALTFERPSKKKPLVEAKIVDRDDDGVVRARQASFGALVDALLGP